MILNKWFDVANKGSNLDENILYETLVLCIHLHLIILTCIINETKHFVINKHFQTEVKNCILLRKESHVSR